MEIKSDKNIFHFYLPGILSFLAACLLVFYLCRRFYQNYEQELVSKEQEQLLTMARTVGKSLVHYVDQELESMDLYYSALDSWKDSRDLAASGPEKAAEYFLEENPGLYDAVSCYGPDGELISQKGETSFDAAMLPDEGSAAAICGKQLCPDGWYQMYIARSFTWNEEWYTAVYAMNLNEIHRRIVAPVKIGEGGYSVVKDSSLSIIMHHAPDQIGMDAIYDRRVRYPQLDLTDLFDWISQQKSSPEGCDVIQTYVWDDPALPSIRRIIAYTTIHLPGEDWIVNSTLPYEELGQPLRSMIFRLASISLLFLCILCVYVYVMTRSLVRMEGQRKELEYFKEINAGMELLRRKDEEIQHYQRIQSIGQMSSHIAHEFNNYLTPIMVYGELLENDPSISATQQEMVHGILKSAEQAADLSRRLLDFSRQDSSVTLTSICLTEDVRDACKVIRQLTPRSVLFISEIADMQIYVSGRRGMVEHILMNLSNNAFHAMEKQKGMDERENRLTITLSAVEDSDAAFVKEDEAPQGAKESKEGEGNQPCADTGEERRHSWALLTVSDTGCGISKEAMDKIFEPFYTTKRSGKGTGLGLSVVRNIMTACGGHIRIESAVGEGTAFKLYFPQIQGGKETRKEAHKIRKVVVVDDEPEIFKSIGAFLEQAGYQCECYDHPAAVLSRIQKQKDYCDAILTDYAMPAMDGLEFAGIVRRLNADIRLILMSGMEDPRFEWYLKNKFIDSFLLKSDLAGLLLSALQSD